MSITAVLPLAAALALERMGLTMQYRLFGLTVASPIPLPEAPPAGVDTVPDVQVVFGQVDTTALTRGDSVEFYGGKEGWWQAAPSASIFAFNCLAGVFLVENGNTITVDAAPDTPPERLRMFILGSAMGAVQVQRGRLPVHGGAIVSKGRAVIITGWPGAGKSTMTSALVQNGFKYLTDDVAALRDAPGGPEVVPAYPQRKLVRDACLAMGYKPEELPVVDARRDKFAVRDRACFHDETTPAGMLIQLTRAKEGAAISAEPVQGHAQLGLLMANLYRPWMHRINGQLGPAAFKQMLDAAAAMRMVRVQVPGGLDNILNTADQLAQLLEL